MRVGQTGNNTSAEITSTQGAKHTDKAHAKKTREGTTATATDTSGSVKTELSARGKELANAKAAATGAPDVREEKIAELKRRIAEGKYKVDSGAVADRMVDEHLEMSGIG